MVWVGLRQGLSRPQDADIVMVPPHDLEPRGQALVREAAWHRGGRLTRQIERIGEGAPVVPVDAVGADRSIAAQR